MRKRNPSVQAPPDDRHGTHDGHDRNNLEEASGGNPAVFLVESVEKIADVDAPAAPDHMRRLIYFASLTAKMQGASSKREWTESISPANAGKCRRLGKSPTDEALEKYSVSV